MTQADDPFLLVHAYCDGELDPANALALERRMADDPRLAAERDRIVALKRAMARLRPAAAPPGLRPRIERAVGMRRPAARPTWSALAASVALAVVISAGATWSVLAPGSGLVADEIVGSHIRSLMAAQPFDVASSDRHTVKPWFNGRIAQSPRVVDLAAAGFPLVGGRIDVIARTPVPSLVYGYQKHLISVTQTLGLGAPPRAQRRRLPRDRLERRRRVVLGSVGRRAGRAGELRAVVSRRADGWVTAAPSLQRVFRVLPRPIGPFARSDTDALGSSVIHRRRPCPETAPASIAKRARQGTPATADRVGPST
jgi:anti-sigma factor RsiW